MSALLTSFIGLLGVVVGGGVTYATQRRLEEVRDKSERKREARQATAVTRLLRDDLWRTQGAIHDICVENRIWWQTNPMRSELSGEDLRLIAGALEDWDRWEAFSHGIGMFRLLDARRIAAGAAGTSTLTDDDVAFAEFVAEALDGARAAIAELAGGDYKSYRSVTAGHPTFTRDVIAR